MSSKRVVVYGALGVGKTSLLAAAASHPESVPRRIRLAIAPSVLSMQWDRLLAGRPSENVDVNVDLELAGGRALRIEEASSLRSDVFARADAVLLVVEARACDEGRLDDIRTAVGRTPAGLVVTKCEQKLRREDPAWDGRPGWWRDVFHFSPTVVEWISSRFGCAVWPTSVFGYDPETGHPAMVLGEFGELLPLRIDPRGVSEPFEWVLTRLGLASPETRARKRAVQ